MKFGGGARKGSLKHPLTPEAKSTPKYFAGANNVSLVKDKQHKPGTIKYFTYEDGGNYRGECTGDGKRHGNGTYTYVVSVDANGDVYSGVFVMGKREGFGTYIHQVGGRYEGEWMNDTMHGRGKFIFHSGSVYEGGWFNNNQHGLGMLTEPDGSYNVEHIHGKLVKKSKIETKEPDIWSVLACTQCQPRGDQ